MAETINQDQADYWTSDSGKKWIAFETEIDTILEIVNHELIRQSAPRPGEHILDIGCGTGATSRAFANFLAPDGSVTAIDISAPLLSHAKTRAADLEIRSDFYALDAQTGDIPNAPFDLVISRFGVMFFDDPVQAFQNIRRHMKPGARLVLAAWAPLKFNPWFYVPANSAIAHLGPVEPMGSTEPGPLAFQDINRVVGILDKAGFHNPTGATVDLKFHHPGPLETVANLSVNLGPVERIMRTYDGTNNDYEIIRGSILRELTEFADEDGINIPAKLNFFSAKNIK